MRGSAFWNSSKLSPARSSASAYESMVSEGTLDLKYDNPSAYTHAITSCLDLEQPFWAISIKCAEG
jgi:hypothetical protein